MAHDPVQASRHDPAIRGNQSEAAAEGQLAADDDQQPND
jgi:hypothetical protein